MAATAVSLGTVGVFGITSEQTGLIIESLTYDYSNSMKEIKNRTGNTTGVTYYDEKIAITINGKIPTATPFSGTIAAALVLGNALTNHAYLKGGVTGGLTILESVSLDTSQEDYQGLSLKATFYPNITA